MRRKAELTNPVHIHLFILPALRDRPDFVLQRVSTMLRGQQISRTQNDDLQTENAENFNESLYNNSTFSLTAVQNSIKVVN